MHFRKNWHTLHAIHVADDDGQRLHGMPNYYFFRSYHCWTLKSPLFEKILWSSSVGNTCDARCVGGGYAVLKPRAYTSESGEYTLRCYCDFRRNIKTILFPKYYINTYWLYKPTVERTNDINDFCYGCHTHTHSVWRLRGDMIEVFKIIKHIYDHKVAPELIYNINKVTRGNDLDCWNTEVTMILESSRSLIE